MSYRPIASEAVRASDVANLNAFMAGGELRSPEEAMRLLCTLRSIVAYSGATEFPGTCSDCFCGDGRMGTEYWRNSGDELRFIIAATEKALRKVSR